jgi:glycosyltransferase involved in cell wall biosynthesis
MVRADTMKIGLDFCNLDPEFAGGVNTFAFGLARGLLATREPGEEFVLLVTDQNEAFLRRMFAKADVTFLNMPVTRLGNIVDSILFKLSWLVGNFRLRFWYDSILRAGLMRRIDKAVDVYVAPLTLLRWYGARAPALLCIHDIQQEYHPELFSFANRLRRWTPYRLSAWRAAGIQASSRYIHDCLVEKFRFVNPEKIFVIPEGVDVKSFGEGPDAMPASLGPVTDGGFVFYPAQIWAHKNHLLLVDALALYRDRTGTELPCVMTGRDYGFWPAVEARIRAHGLKQVRYLGRVSFEQLLWLYRHCLAVLALGLHESSSLPLREGAVFGKALIGLDIPPNREDSARFRIRLVDGAESLADAFLALSENGVVSAARENAALSRDFDWKGIAGEYRRILKQLVRT